MKVFLRNRRAGVTWLAPEAPQVEYRAQYTYRAAIPAATVGGVIAWGMLMARGDAEQPEGLLNLASA